jgi:hypothetical protein
MTGYFDFLLVLVSIIQSQPVPCQWLRLATLSFSRRNVAELCRLLDTRQVERLTLLCSDFMHKSNSAVYQGACTELVEARGQTVASARSHCKVATLAFRDGLRLSFEGSANARTNRNTEQVTCINDPGLHDWHAQWIDEKVADHEEYEG